MMPLHRENLIMILIAILVALAQILFAPYMAISYATPNFMAAYAVVIAAVRPSSDRVVVLGFIMGLLYGLFVGGPVGAMAISLLVSCFAVGRGVVMLDNGTKFMPLVLVCVGVVLNQLVYALLFVFASQGVGVVEAFMYRMVPCSLYDAAIGLVLFLIMSSIASEKSNNVSIGGPTLLR